MAGRVWRVSVQPLNDLPGRELKFRQLASQIRRGIADGTWPAEAKLPSEQSFAESTGLSVNTVRRALDELAEMGLVVRRQGAGTFVAASLSATSGRCRPRLGVLIPETHLYFRPVLRGIEDVAATAGCRLIIRTTCYEPDADIPALQELLAAGVDGLLLTPSTTEPPSGSTLARRLAELTVPAVYVERRFASQGAADSTEHVCTDHAGGAFDAVTHLGRLGHRDFALLVRENAAPTSGVAAGFEQAVSHLKARSVLRIDWRQEYQNVDARADQALHEIMDAGSTALLCFGEHEMTQLLGAVQRMGIRVPEEIALISFGDNTASARLHVTAVSPEKYRMGRMATEFLLRRLEAPDARMHQVRLRPRLIVRGTCGASTS